MRRLPAALLGALALTLLQPVAAAADQRSYALAVVQARSYVEEGLQGRSDAAAEALGVLEPEVAATQPEIIADLRHDPPYYADAEKRLAAVAAAMAEPGDVADGAAAKATLNGILAQQRYSGLHGDQSLWNRFWNWVLTQFFAWLATLNLGALPVWVPWTILSAAGLLTAFVAALIARTGWTRAGKALQTAREESSARRINRFAEADALAAKRDFTAALRSLVAGVATAVSGQPYWESSPLTVRELFRSSGKLDPLRPLLVDFERSVYGFQPVDEATYRRAEQIASAYREEAGEQPEAAA